MKKFFGFGSSTPHPPPPPSKPPSPPAASKSAPSPSAPKPAAKPVASIVGKWREPSGSDTTEFRADGTVIERPATGEMIQGRYSLDGARLKITLESVPDDLSFTVAFKTDALEMTDQEGQMTRYERVR